MDTNEANELAVSEFRRKVLIGSIKKLKDKIMTKGINDHERARCLAHIGYMANELGDTEEANRANRQALRFNPENSMARQALSIQ